MRRPRFVLVAIAPALAAVTLAAQDPQVFRGGVRTVPVYVSVTDRRGGFVLDLTKDEFEIRDNGRVQAITQFTTDLQPLSLVILIDGSGSMLQVFDSVIEAANSLIMRMLPTDRTAIASFADIFQMRQPFTSNREELLAHLEDQFNIRMANETRLWEALTESVMALSKEQARRVVIVLSDGKQWAQNQGPTGLPINGQPFLTRAPYDLVTLALDRDVMIYAIAVWTRDEKTVERPSTSIESLATETGGGYVEMKESDDLGSLASRISKELHQQYVLGFTPQVLDGKTHKLDVKVTRPGVTIRARRSYLASKAGKDH
jgi:Ca-activated chloride channel family protein